MSILEAIILGILQGATEFLPVSSSGHLLLAQELFGLSSPGILLEVVLHLGTLCAVVIFYRYDLLAMLKKPSPTLWYLALATLPAVAAALLLGDLVDGMYETVRFLPYAFLLTAALLSAGEAASRRRASLSMQRKRVNAGDAAAMGVMQAVAIIPGISRSGSTVAGGLFRGLTRAEAARFSFLMSIPAILGSLVLELKNLLTDGAASLPLLPLLVGAVAAALSGVYAITFMLRALNPFGLLPFILYTALLGGALIFIL